MSAAGITWFSTTVHAVERQRARPPGGVTTVTLASASPVSASVKRKPATSNVWPPSSGIDTVKSAAVGTAFACTVPTDGYAALARRSPPCRRSPGK